MEASIDVTVSIAPRELGKKTISKWDIVNKIKKQRGKKKKSHPLLGSSQVFLTSWDIQNSYFALVFLPLVQKGIDPKEYWFSISYW